MCLKEDHNWKHVTDVGKRVCLYCGKVERLPNYKGPIEVEKIEPYSYGQSGKPTKVVSFIIGLLLLLLLGSVIILGITVAYILTFGG
jgi:hypothetical protein